VPSSKIRRAATSATVWRRAGGGTRETAGAHVPATEATARRLVITVCPRERGTVVLPVEPGGRRRRLDASALARCLQELVSARRLEGRVELRLGCAGGCSHAGPNVDVRIHRLSRPGDAPDQVAMDWKTYVYSLASLRCLAAVVDDNLHVSE
jgi:hypothetical protein